MIWKIIPGLEDYEVGESGLVRRLTRAQGTKPGRIYRGAPGRGGYLLVRLCLGGRSRLFRVHRLVLLAFVGPPPVPGLDGAHRDGDRTNNHVSNLRWATRLANMADARAHGTIPYGESKTQSKLTAAKVLIARQRFAEGAASQRSMAREFGVSLGVLQRAIHGKSWAHLK